MEKLPISLVVIIRNGKDNLKQLIETHRPLVSEVVVLDQSSTDGTFEVAKELADIAVQRRNKGYCEPDREYAISLTNQPYVLMLDDDERLSDELRDKMEQLIKSSGDVFWLRRQNFVDGVDIEEIMGEDYQCRFWKAGAVRWSDEIHKFPESAVNTKVFYIKSPIEHHRTFEGLKKANQRRNEVVREQGVVDMQNRFILGVENFLSKKAAVE